MIFKEKWISLFLFALELKLVLSSRQSDIDRLKGDNSIKDDNFRPKRTLLDLIDGSIRSREARMATSNKSRDKEVLLIRKAIMMLYRQTVSQKRSCVEWWCIGDKATETPGTTRPSTTFPTTTKSTTRSSTSTPSPSTPSTTTTPTTTTPTTPTTTTTMTTTLPTTTTTSTTITTTTTPTTITTLKPSTGDCLPEEWRKFLEKLFGSNGARIKG